MASKTKVPKYIWYVLTPNNHAKDEFPRRHAVLPETRTKPAHEQRAICGGLIEREAVELRGPKTIEKHPICGRCGAKVRRFEIMQG